MWSKKWWFLPWGVWHLKQEMEGEDRKTDTVLTSEKVVFGSVQFLKPFPLQSSPAFSLNYSRIHSHTHLILLVPGFCFHSFSPSYLLFIETPATCHDVSEQRPILWSLLSLATERERCLEEAFKKLGKLKVKDFSISRIPQAHYTEWTWPYSVISLCQTFFNVIVKLVAVCMGVYICALYVHSHR